MPAFARCPNPVTLSSSPNTNTNTSATIDPDRSTTPLLTYAKQAISLPYALVAALPRAPEHDRGHEHEHDHNEDDDTRPTPPPPPSPTTSA